MIAAPAAMHASASAAISAGWIGTFGFLLFGVTPLIAHSMMAGCTPNHSREDGARPPPTRRSERRQTHLPGTRRSRHLKPHIPSADYLRRNTQAVFGYLAPIHVRCH